jgi:hypothetical protein
MVMFGNHFGYVPVPKGASSIVRPAVSSIRHHHQAKEASNGGQQTQTCPLVTAGDDGTLASAEFAAWMDTLSQQETTVIERINESAPSDTFVFALARNPLWRFWSGWREICKYESTPAREFSRAKLVAMLGTASVCNTEQGEEGGEGEESGGLFFTLALSTTLKAMACGVYFDAHIAPQHRLLRPFLAERSSGGTQ